MLPFYFLPKPQTTKILFVCPKSLPPLRIDEGFHVFGFGVQSQAREANATITVAIVEFTPDFKALVLLIAPMLIYRILFFVESQRCFICCQFFLVTC